MATDCGFLPRGAHVEIMSVGEPEAPFPDCYVEPVAVMAAKRVMH